MKNNLIQKLKMQFTQTIGLNAITSKVLSWLHIYVHLYGTDDLFILI